MSRTDPRIALLMPSLTDREREVVRLMAAGCTNQEIADRLGIAWRTVATHVVSICRKLDAPNRTAAVVRHYRGGA